MFEEFEKPEIFEKNRCTIMPNSTYTIIVQDGQCTLGQTIGKKFPSERKKQILSFFQCNFKLDFQIRSL